MDYGQILKDSKPRWMEDGLGLRGQSDPKQSQQSLMLPFSQSSSPVVRPRGEQLDFGNDPMPFVDNSSTTGTGGGGGGVTALKPWDIIATPAEGGGFNVKLYPATLGGYMPTGMFTEFFVDDTETAFFVVSATTDGKAVTSCSLGTETSAPTPSTPALGAAPSTFKCTVAIMTNGTAYNLWGKSLSATPKEVLREDKPSPSALELPYRSYYNWLIA